MMEPDETVVTSVGPASKASMPVVPGFDVLHLLGQGGMGQVYAARQRKLERVIALKLVSSAHDEAVLARFGEEVKAVASLRHPHIAQIYESGQVEGRPYYAMELVTGGTLSERLKTGPLAPRQAAELLVKLAQAVQHAHEQNILHRDLKPSNILLEEKSLIPKITDFGLAKRLGGEVNLTHTGDIFGSPSYMAPEQASGVMKLTSAVDVYALGAVLYECLTGRPPFLGPDPMQTLMLAMSSDPLPPRQLQPRLPADLNTICMKCLEKLPKKRYSSAQSLADDLQRYLNGEPIIARPVGVVEWCLKWAMRRPWQAAAVGLAVALFVGLFVGMLILQKTYREVRTASEEANKSFGLSRNALTKLLDKLSGDLATLPNTEKIVLDSYRPAVELFRDLHALRPYDHQTALDYFQQLQNYATRLALSHHFDDAQAIMAESDRLLDEQIKQRPDDIDWRQAAVTCHINHGWIARRRGRRDEAVSYEQMALTSLAMLKQQYPGDVRWMTMANTLLQSSIADTIAQSQRAEPAEKANLIAQVISKYREIMQNCERVYQLQPDHEHASMLLSSKKSLATILVVANQTEEAERLYQSIATILPSLHLEEQYRLSFQVQMDNDRGDLARRRRDFAVASTLFQQAHQSSKQLRDRYPEDAGYLYDWLFLRYKVALMQHDEGKREASITELKACVRDVDAALLKHPQYATLSTFRKKLTDTLEHYADESPRTPGK